MQNLRQATKKHPESPLGGVHSSHDLRMRLTRIPSAFQHLAQKSG